MIRIAAVDDEMHVLERFERMVLNVKNWNYVVCLKQENSYYPI